MRFKNKAPKIDRNFANVQSRIPKSIRDKIKRYTPDKNLMEVKEIIFRTNLTASEKTTLLNLFPELEEEI